MSKLYKTKHFLHPSDPNPYRCLQGSHSQLTLAESLNNFFVSVSTDLPPLNPNTSSPINPDDMSDFIVDPAEVEFRLARIKTHKAAGPDGIPNWLLRDFSSLLCQPLAAVFNASIREGYFPPIWKSAEVVPIPKVHPPTSIQNDLRPISLLPTLAKIREGIIKDWLMPILEPSLDKGQFGCRQGRSTTHTL